MQTKRKDLMILYMLRNAFSTLFIALISFTISLISYYHCTWIEALQRLFLVNIYTTLYFLLIWLLNYMIFEISKIIYDTYEKLLSYKLCIVLFIMAVVVFEIPMRDLFQWDFSLLFVLIALRQVKQLWLHKKRP